MKRLSILLWAALGLTLCTACGEEDNDTGEDAGAVQDEEDGTEDSSEDGAEDNSDDSTDAAEDGSSDGEDGNSDAEDSTEDSSDDDVDYSGECGRSGCGGDIGNTAWRVADYCGADNPLEGFEQEIESGNDEFQQYCAAASITLQDAFTGLVFSESDVSFMYYVAVDWNLPAACLEDMPAESTCEDVLENIISDDDEDESDEEIDESDSEGEGFAPEEEVQDDADDDADDCIPVEQLSCEGTLATGCHCVQSSRCTQDPSSYGTSGSNITIDGGIIPYCVEDGTMSITAPDGEGGTQDWIMVRQEA